MKFFVFGLLITLGLSSMSLAQHPPTARQERRREERRVERNVERHEERRIERHEERAIERAVERHEAREAWRPHPGWTAGWRWNRNYYPRWYRAGLVFPVFFWVDVPVGYWQCTAFNGNLTPSTAIGPDQNQAAYGALYKCGGRDYEAFGCYIPNGYCQLRY